MVKKGPLTREELMLIWSSAVDTSFREPLEEAGDGNGLEVFGQTAEQLARVSRAIDETTQALYILTNTGQTAEPASGERKATVTLKIARASLTEFPIVIAKGFIVEEETTDAGEEGPLVVTTGRRYLTTEDVIFMPGETGPFEVNAEAERPGWGYNNPLPETITRIVQVGSDFERDRATVVAPDATTGSVALPMSGYVRSVNEADTFVPEHVGQYLRFWAGANMAKIARIVGFEPPDSTVPRGSVAEFDVVHAFEGTLTGTFLVGESASLGGVGTGIVLGERADGSLVIRHAGGTAASVGTVITGGASAATLTVTFVSSAPSYNAEAPSGGIGGAGWRVLSWKDTLGITVTHDASPSGGRSAILDAIGDERALPRAPGESDTNYRARLATLADVVTPNAIKRALSRSLGAIGWAFREVGSADLPGLFFDGTLEVPIATPGRPQNDAFDTDVLVYTGTLTGTFQFQEPCVVMDDDENFGARGFVGSVTGGTSLVLIRRDGKAVAGGTYRVRGLWSGASFLTTAVNAPASVVSHRYRRWFDYEQFRGYFVVEVDRLGIGEFGFAYDVGTANAWDTGCMDGYPAGNPPVYLRAHQSVSETVMGGVGFHFEPKP